MALILKFWIRIAMIYLRGKLITRVINLRSYLFTGAYNIDKSSDTLWEDKITDFLNSFARYVVFKFDGYADISVYVSFIGYFVRKAILILASNVKQRYKTLAPVQ